MKRNLMAIILLIQSISAWSQADRIDSLLNDVVWGDREMMTLLDPPSSFCYLYGGLSGENKTMYAGRELEENMMTMNGNLFFFHSKGVFLGASGTWYGDPGEGYSNTILSAGIYRPVNAKKNLNFRASYSHYFYAGSDSLYDNPFTNSLGAGLSLRNNWIGGRLSLNVLFGQDFGMNFSPAVFSRLPVFRFGKYNKLQLEPELSVFFGSASVELDQMESQSGQQATQTEIVTENKYGLLNTQFCIPLCLYIGDFDLEVGYSLNIPSSQDENMDYPVSSYFSFSIGYLIPLF